MNIKILFHQTIKLSYDERYIDSFCDRTLKSVLARHYTDYSPERLREYTIELD